MIPNVGGTRHNASAYLNYRKTCAGYWRWGRRRRRRWRWAGCRRRRRRWQRDIPSGLNTNKRWRAGFKVAYHRIGWIGRLIGIEPEIIQRAVANGVGVLILRKGVGVPSDRACVLSNSPRSAAISQAVKGAIICPGRMLNRRMKTDVGNVYSWPNRHAERLNRAIEVLVVESIFIVPDATSRVGDFVAHEPDAIIAVIRFDLIYRCTSPSCNARLLSHGGAHGTKSERLVDSGHAVLTVRSIVIHVALVRMTLTPGAFVGDDVFRFGKIRCPRV